MNTSEILTALDAALRAVVDADETEGSEPTGLPTYEGDAIDLDEPSLKGRIPAKVGWTADRGTWMWDGVLAMARAMAIDINATIDG